MLYIIAIGNIPIIMLFRSLWIKCNVHFKTHVKKIKKVEILIKSYLMNDNKHFSVFNNTWLHGCWKCLNQHFLESFGSFHHVHFSHVHFSQHVVLNRIYCFHNLKSWIVAIYLWHAFTFEERLCLPYPHAERPLNLSRYISCKTYPRVIILVVVQTKMLDPYHRQIFWVLFMIFLLFMTIFVTLKLCHC